MGTNQPREFQPGDVVRLKSGGTYMTVVGFWEHRTSEEVSVICKWFRGENRDVLEHDYFPEAALEKVT
jgi:uncharacterized protein YodC (DUF2158 family)